MYDPYQIILKPVVTEKSSGLRADSVYVFKVLKDATKDQIKNAVQKAFGVDAVSINTTKLQAGKKLM